MLGNSRSLNNLFWFNATMLYRQGKRFFSERAKGKRRALGIAATGSADGGCAVNHLRESTFWVTKYSVFAVRRGFLLGAFAMYLWCVAASAQIDPVKRDLIQLGYNGALEGHAPLSAYAFYYRNDPGFLRTNLTLRLAVAPTYLDSELGIAHALGPNTDLGIGLAGGGFADSYNEIRGGTYIPHESFDGYSGSLSSSVYHLFNPGDQIPLNGLIRGTARFVTYDRGSDTASDFEVPPDLGSFNLRTGLRWGGREPTLYPSLAMELSIWYEGEFRTTDSSYGYDGDRHLEQYTHLFWSQAYLAYTLPELKHTASLGLIAGTSVDPDRLSAYRLGGLLPMVSEFPLSLPGYYYQELSARQFVMLNSDYIMPLDKHQHWNLNVTASTAFVDYLSGLEQPGHWHSGVGGGLFYTSSSWRVMAGYGYGFDAMRTHGRGAQSLGLLLQLDLEHARNAIAKPEPPGRWRGFQRMLDFFGG
jgi:hypothetical protein